MSLNLFNIHSIEETFAAFVVLSEREVDTEGESKLPSFTIIENRSNPGETQQLSVDASSAVDPLRHNVQTCSSY